jgi:hypothetical protein
VWPAHAIFATILVGSLAAREQAAKPIDDSLSLLEPAVLRVAGSRGWGFREYRTNSGMVSRTLVFEAPGCSQPVEVSLRLSTFEEETLAESAPEPGYLRRYIYFDQTWDTPDPRAAVVQRMKYAALATFGLTKYTPSWYLLQVEAPPNCRAAKATDWRSIWNRDDLAAAQASADAAPKQ